MIEIASSSEVARLNSDERLQLALDAGVIAGTWFWDVQRDYFTADVRFAKFFGLDAEALRSGMRLAEVVQSIHPDDEPIVQRLIAEVLARGGAYRAEYRVRQLDGHYRWIEANGRVTLDTAGRAISFPGVLIDIDARKRREVYQEALIALGDQLRDSEHIEDIVRAASKTCAETLGVSRAGYGSIDGLGTHVLITADWRVKDSISTLAGFYRFNDFGTYIGDLRTGRVVAIDDVERDDRTAANASALAELQIRSLLNVPLMQEGRLAGIFLAHHVEAHPWQSDEISFVRSLADRTWAAIAVVKSAEQMRAVNADLEREVRQRTTDRNLLWQISGDLMIVARFNGQIVAVNPAWQKLLGWSEEELIGNSLFDLIHPDDLEHTVQGASSISTGTTYPVFENRYRCKNGSYRHISWSAAPAEDFMVAAGRDVTDSKEQQESLRQAEDQLRQSQKMEAVGQLTGGIAHDFNNLLTIVSTSVQLLRRPDPEGRRQPRLIESIAGAVERASKLTGQLLAFARRQSLQPVVFDAKHNIVAMQEMLQTLIGSRIHLEIEGDDDPYWVDADPGQFDTAIVNMAANARDAMDGTGSLRMVLRRAAVMPALRQHAAIVSDFVTISITDTGSGIAADLLQKVFEPFYTTKPVGHGTGLGLSQVFGFAKQSGGDVQVHSRLGQGTTFTVYLPQATRLKDLESEMPMQTAGPARACGTVLLVEDNNGVADVAKTALEDLGYSVHTCHSGTEALDVLERNPTRFVAMFTDVMMAGMDGITLAREVRRLYPELPILLTSGYSSVLANSEDRGFSLLAKPYGPESLGIALRKAMAA